jgi:hypothetical protein
MKGAEMVTLHAPLDQSHTAAATAPFTMDVYAFGAFVCCIVLLGWWAWMQSESRCTDCGYCPVWCGCDA